MSDVDFQLKGSTITVVVLELNRYQPNHFAKQLAEKIQQAPQFFAGSPVLIDVRKLAEEDLVIDFPLLVHQCRNLGLQPIAFKGAGENFSQGIAETGLASLPEATTRAKTSDLKAPADKSATDESVEAAQQEAENPSKDEPDSTTDEFVEQTFTRRSEDNTPDVVIKTITEERLIQRPAKMITRPVRSGQQVYAEGADLIVLAQVSQGAEVLADGNIHVYGPLRGRALAGARGDTSARVFCQAMQAELISVAGNFLLSDSLQDNVRNRPAQAFLQGDVLSVMPL